MRRTVELLAVAILLALAASAQTRSVTIGVLNDGPWQHNERINGTFENEVRSLLGRRYDVRFPDQKRLQADWTLAGVRQNLDQLMSDPDVDVIITLGVLGSNEACHRATLPKPVVAPFVLDAEMQGTPRTMREVAVGGQSTPDKIVSSGVENLSYVIVGSDLGHEMDAFRQIVPFNHLAVLSMQALVDGIEGLSGRVQRDAASIGLENTTVIRVGTTIDSAIDQLPAETDAVYVTPLLQLEQGEFERLIQILIDKKLPSFSLWGESEVEQGLLASLSLEQDLTRIGRRVAVNIHNILMGEAAAELPVEFESSERLTLNLATGRAIGVYPSFALLTEARVVGRERGSAGRMLSLESVIREAEQVNLDLAAAEREVAAGQQSVRQARSSLLPQLGIGGSSTFIDGDRADASFGSQGRRRVAGTVEASQLIYSERVRAGYDIEQRLQDGRVQQFAQLRLDVIRDVAVAYLNVLRAATFERIRTNNLDLTRSNLQTSQSRVELGAAGREEVLRWESQIAQNRIDLISANAQRNQAEIALNTLLNRPAEESFSTQEAVIDDPQITSGFEGIRPFIDSPDTFRVFRQFMAGEALVASPELRQLDASILAQKRTHLAAKRQFYVPDVSLVAQAEGFKNGGTGESSTGSAMEAPGLELPRANSLNWTVGVNASLPLFQGGALRAQRLQAEIELSGLTLRREATRLLVEQGIRSALHQAGASFAGINLTRQAAEAARENLDIVQDAYSEGAVDILRVLDAQNQLLTAQLTASSAIFDYLLDLMEVQRRVGKFDYFRSAVERDAFLDRVAKHFEEAGVLIRKP